MTRNVFVSHRSLDGEFAATLTDCIRASGVDAYLDKYDEALQAPTAARIAVPITRRVEQELAAATDLLAVITPFSRNSDWVPYEIGMAQQRGLGIAAAVQSGVRTPEYLSSATLIRSREDLLAWLDSLGATTTTEVSRTLDELDSWFSRGIHDRGPLYRSAIDHLESLWDPRTWEALQLEDEDYAFKRCWMGCASPELIHVLYSMLAPMVALYPRTAGLSELERSIIEAIYRSFSADQVLARTEPVRPYDARSCTNWRTLRKQDPARYWLQGLLPRDLDSARSALRGADGRLISRETTAQAYLSLYRGPDTRAQKPLGLAANALQGFTLATRPIFARLAAVQVRLYNALLRLELGGEVPTRRNELFACGQRSPFIGSEEEAVSFRYLGGHVLPEVAIATGSQPEDFA